MPPKARTSTKSASYVPAQYQILSRPSSSDTLIAQSPPDLSGFQVSQNPPTMVPSVPSPQAMPMTPPRPISMKSLPPHGQHQSASPLTESKLRGSVTRTYGHTQTKSSPPVPKKSSDTPRERPKSQTPSRSSVTPSQAYAGPLFHASPAASALPIPKWFSKTINERKERSEEVVLETGAKNPVPDQSDESPTMRKSRMDTKPLPDEHPPKFHMPADRAEKSKGREGSLLPASTLDDRLMSLSLSDSTLVEPSASPDTNGPHQPRHLSSHPSKEHFSLETEDSSDSSVPKKGSHLRRNISESARPSTAPSEISAQNVDEEDKRKARSLALKKLLQTPVPQRPVSAASHLRTTTSNNGPRAPPPARNLSGPSTSIASPTVEIPNIPSHSYLQSSYSQNNANELLEATQQSHKATQLLAPHSKPDTFERLKRFYDFGEFGTASPRIENRPLSYGQRAMLMEDHSNRGTTFKGRPGPPSSQISRDLDSTSLTKNDRAKLLEDYIQCHESTCSCKSVSSSQQSSPSVESASPTGDDRSKSMKDFSRSGSSLNCRPSIISQQSFPGADSTPVVREDPKKWLDNHLRYEILKIGTFGSDGATEVAT